MEDPLTQVDDGLLLQVEVVPGAPEDRFPAGFNPWRGRVKAKVEAQAQEGQANAALCTLVAEHLGLGSGAVTIARGHTSRQKTLHLAGAREADLRERLRGVLEA